MNTLGPILPKARLLALLLVSFIPAILHGETAVQAWVQRYNGLGNNTDTAYGIAVDSSNSVIVAGTSLGSGTGFDYATVKYSSKGLPLWTNRFNGAANGAENVVAVVVDGSDQVIVAGYSAISSNNEYLTLKYSAVGVPVWTNHYSVAGSDAKASAVAVDTSKNVIVTGSASNDFVTIQYSSAGVPLWTNRYNGPANGADVPCAITVDGSDNVIVTGRSQSSGIGSDYLTIKYSNTGIPLWTNRYDGSNIDEPSALVLDSSNNVVVTGRSVNGGYYSFGTIKISSAGVPLWTNYFREPSGTTAYANAIAVDSANNVFVTGSWYAGLYENYATVGYSSAGVPRWTNYYNGPANTTDIGRAVKVDDNDNVIVSGYSSDYATIKYSNAGVPIWTNIYNGPGNGGDSAYAMAVDHNGDVIVTGQSDGGSSAFDYATIKFTSPPVLTGGQITNGLCEIRMRRPNTVVIEATTSLSAWTPIFTNNSSTNLFIYSDPNSSGSARRFYRAIRQP